MSFVELLLNGRFVTRQHRQCAVEGLAPRDSSADAPRLAGKVCGGRPHGLSAPLSSASPRCRSRGQRGGGAVISNKWLPLWEWNLRRIVTTRFAQDQHPLLADWFISCSLPISPESRHSPRPTRDLYAPSSPDTVPRPNNMNFFRSKSPEKASVEQSEDVKHERKEKLPVFRRADSTPKGLELTTSLPEGSAVNSLGVSISPRPAIVS